MHITIIISIFAKNQLKQITMIHDLSTQKGRNEYAKSDAEKLVTLHENQYIPYKSKSLPSGMPACATYYYFMRNGKVLDRVTLKPYRGKQMDRYAMHSNTEAEAYLEVINK